MENKKPIKTLDELSRELTSEHGAICEGVRYRIDSDGNLRFFRDEGWILSHHSYLEGFLLATKEWFYYEVPKKVERRIFSGFVRSDIVESSQSAQAIIVQKNLDKVFNIRARVIIEREVDDGN